MIEKKNIDRLFQERFKDFESAPNQKIWNNIHSALHEKKKRKIIPLWWKLSGIAAGIVLLFFTYNGLTTTSISEPAVVLAPKEFKNTKDSKLNPETKAETQVAIENTDTLVIENGVKNTEMRSNSKIETRIAVENSSSSVVENNSPTRSNQKSYSEKNIENKSIEKTTIPKTNQVATVANNSNLNSKQKRVERNKNIKEEVVIHSSIEKTIDKDALSKQSKDEKTEIIAISFKNNDAIKSKVLKKTDSTALALVSEINPLEEILKMKNEKEEGVLAAAKLNRWQVTTNVAPVYFNSASNGSPIENQFAENGKSYENNLSVGIGVQYAVSKKLSVRAGFNKVILGYDTNDVMFFGALNAPGFNTLSADNSKSKIEVISANNVERLRPYEDNIQNMERGVLNQQMGYYEVPLELSYALVNRKFGVHVIGGLSTLFLSENTVSVQSATTTMGLGKANNLNDIHFSSNIGLGFKYEFLKSFEVHFEPTFKYQFNTFSRDAGNFKPYFVGLYTGVSFKF